MFDLKDLTRDKIAYIDERWRLDEAAEVLCNCDQVFLPVVNRNLEPVGIITEKDILSWVCNGRDKNARVSDCMRTKFTTIDSKTSLVDLVYIFARENHSQMQVVSNGIVCGLIKRSSVIKYLLDRKKAAGKVECGS
jgi:predicted transcriptional regulator